MKLPRTYTLKEIAEIADCPYAGSENHVVTGINEIHVVEPGDIVFVDHPKYYDKALKSAATTIIINKEVEIPEGKGLILSDEPFRIFNNLTLHFSSKQTWEKDTSPKIHPTAQVAPGVVMGKNVVIGPNSVI
ncbi:MAG TPA: LpxD N-terminal domain-containing protein, partial [Cryomorphaceae bacterium]|nr:LpxD N-terminal domain-containing protein [Cryomorphaceae bacterium]